MCPRGGRSRVTFHGSYSQFRVAVRVYPESLLLLVKGLAQYLKYLQHSFWAGDVVSPSVILAECNSKNSYEN